MDGTKISLKKSSRFPSRVSAFGKLHTFGRHDSKDDAKLAAENGMERLYGPDWRQLARSLRLQNWKKVVHPRQIGVRPLIDNQDGTHRVVLPDGDDRVTIDSIDADRVGRYNWCRKTRGRYHVHSMVGGESTLLSRFIMDAMVGEHIVHLDRDPSNNRRSNLYITDCHGAQLLMSNSLYPGIYKSYNKYSVKISREYTTYWIPGIASLEDALAIQKDLITELFGPEFYRLYSSRRISY